ncbi:copper chaperone PCu(A)C [Gynuella sp.]|uniref:copper chaperone PCu(A)C n=1 Tax=Gynuella sp. TaxID=2969146 RepID=UPI003D0A3A03
MKYLVGIFLTMVVSFAIAADKLSLANAWVREVPPVMKNSAIFFTVKNDSDEDRIIVSASTEVASLTQVHEHTMADGMMKMREVKAGVKIPAHSSVMFKPGGYHVMLIKLNKPLPVGAEVELTLTFDDGSTLVQNVQVRPDNQLHTNDSN